MVNDLTDEQLVKLTLQDQKYYRYLVERYEEKLKRYIFRIIGVNPEDSQDILQEVFLKAYINLNDFDMSLKFSSWIYRITHNEAVSYLRRNKNKFQVINFEIDKNLIETAWADLDIKKELDEKYFLENVQKIIKDFKNKDYQDVLVLRYIEDKDYQEISDILKKPLGTVSTLLSRAKKQLKSALIKNNKLELS